MEQKGKREKEKKDCNGGRDGVRDQEKKTGVERGEGREE